MSIDSYRIVPLDPEGIDRDFRELYRELISRGYYPQLRRVDGVFYLRTYNIGRRRGYRMATVLILMLITIATVAITSYLWYLQDLEIGSRINITTEAFRFGPIYIVILTLSIMGPLAVHEMGHYIASRILRVPATPPYFIPGLPGVGLGTFGAVILMRFFPAVADDLAWVAISGPLAGFLAIIAVTIYGASSSYIVPRLEAGAGFEEISFSPLLFIIITNILSRPGDGYVVILNPVAYAGYFLMLIHFLNLLPVAQLDGGQVLRSIVGPRIHRAVGISISLAMVIAAFFIRADIIYTIAFFLLIVLLLTGLRPHPGPAYSDSKPGRGAIAASILWAAMLSLTIPIPI